MDQATLNQIAALGRSSPLMDSLVHEHTSLEERIGLLLGRPHLTPAETQELVRLKKAKLKVKDQIEGLLQSKSA